MRKLRMISPLVVALAMLAVLLFVLSDNAQVVKSQGRTYAVFTDTVNCAAPHLQEVFPTINQDVSEDGLASAKLFICVYEDTALYFSASTYGNGYRQISGEIVLEKSGEGDIQVWADYDIVRDSLCFDVDRAIDNEGMILTPGAYTFKARTYARWNPLKPDCVPYAETWVKIIGTLPPPPNLCPDGIELVSDTNGIALFPSWYGFGSSTFNAYTVTQWEDVAVRYTYGNMPSFPGQYAAGNASINDANEPYAATGGAFSTEQITVPIVGGVQGPTATVTFTVESGCWAKLHSACVIPRSTLTSTYCTDGIELLEVTPKTLSPNEVWMGGTDVNWDKFYVRLTIENPQDARNRMLDTDVNDKHDQTIIRPQDPNPYIKKIPVVWGSAYPIGIPGPRADITITNNPYSNVDLLSVCVLEGQDGPSELCPDGIEALDSPVILDALNGTWSDSVMISATHIFVKYSVTPYPLVYLPGTNRALLAMPAINGASFYVQMPPSEEEVHFTLPSDDPFKIYDPNVALDYVNLGERIQLNSVCVMDARDVYTDGVIPGLDAQDCFLNNPDFNSDISSFTDWQPSPSPAGPGAVNWLPLEQNGAIELNNWYIVQQALHPRSKSFDIEVRAKGIGGSNELTYGSTYATQYMGGEQLHTAELTAGWYKIFRETVFLPTGATVAVKGNNANVDYVCLVDSSSVLPVQDCDFPDWNPSYDNVLELLAYVVHWLGLVLVWVVCEVVKAIAIAINPIADFIRDLVIGVPLLPDPGSGITSWLEWLKLTIQIFMDYIGLNLGVIFSWMSNLATDIINFLLNLIYELLTWFLRLLGFDSDRLIYEVSGILSDLWAFLFEVLAEMDAERGDLYELLRNTINIFSILINGFRGALSGDQAVDLTGHGAYIWIGVNYFNQVIQGTPLTAINMLALSIISLGLVQWTIKKFSSVLQY